MAKSQYLKIWYQNHTKIRNGQNILAQGLPYNYLSKSDKQTSQMVKMQFLTYVNYLTLQYLEHTTKSDLCVNAQKEMLWQF